MKFVFLTLVVLVGVFRECRSECSVDQFACANGVCIDLWLVPVPPSPTSNCSHCNLCDGNNDCGDNSDETGCAGKWGQKTACYQVNPDVCSTSTTETTTDDTTTTTVPADDDSTIPTTTGPSECGSNQFTCRDGSCIDMWSPDYPDCSRCLVCNAGYNCDDQSDEFNCPAQDVANGACYRQNSNTCPPPAYPGWTTVNVRYFRRIAQQARKNVVASCKALNNSVVYGFQDSPAQIRAILTGLNLIRSAGSQQYWVDADPVGSKWVYSANTSSTVPRNPPPRNVRPITNCLMEVVAPNAASFSWQHDTCSNKNFAICEFKPPTISQG